MYSASKEFCETKASDEALSCGERVRQDGTAVLPPLKHRGLTTKASIAKCLALSSMLFVPPPGSTAPLSHAAMVALGLSLVVGPSCVPLLPAIVVLRASRRYFTSGLERSWWPLLLAGPCAGPVSLLGGAGSHFVSSDALARGNSPYHLEGALKLFRSLTGPPVAGAGG
jgi:hypothetical protein